MAAQGIGDHGREIALEEDVDLALCEHGQALKDEARDLVRPADPELEADRRAGVGAIDAAGRQSQGAHRRRGRA